MEEINDKQGIAICLNNMGSFYLKTGKPAKALEFQMKSIQIKEELNDKKGLEIGYLNISETYVEMKDFSKSEEYLQKSLFIAREINAKDIPKQQGL